MFDTLGTDTTGVTEWTVVDSRNFVFIRPFDTTSCSSGTTNKKKNSFEIIHFVELEINMYTCLNWSALSNEYCFAF